MSGVVVASAADPAAAEPVSLLSAQDFADTRRFCGYPVVASMAGQPLSVQGYSAQVDAVLNGLTAEQVAILQTSFLTNLRLLEADIPGTRDGLDTAKASVYTRNPNELMERISLYAEWRRNLCYFLGVQIGQGIAPLTPAVFFLS